jgi:hypothetical protein
VFSINKSGDQMNCERNMFKGALSGRWRKRITIGLLLSVVGCTTTPRLPTTDAGLVTVPIEFEDYSGQPTVKGPRDSQLWLGAISGEIYGTTQAEFKTLGIGRSATIVLPMSELERLSARSATVLNSAAAAAGFNLIPSDARLVRVATSLLSEDPVWHSASTNLADAVTKKTLVLVYFDRPCRLSGAVITHPASGGTRTDNYDVGIEKAGFTWLETTKVDDSHSEIRRAPASLRPVVTVRTRQTPV